MDRQPSHAASISPRAAVSTPSTPTFHEAARSYQARWCTLLNRTLGCGNVRRTRRSSDAALRFPSERDAEDRVHPYFENKTALSRDRDDCSTLESVVVGFTHTAAIGQAIAESLLNARKRRCRVHLDALIAEQRLYDCSTLESVVVGFTANPPLDPGLIVCCSTLESVVVGFTTAGTVAAVSNNRCSTLESVVVGFTGFLPGDI